VKKHNQLGSIWQKWDLQVHPPCGKIYQSYKVGPGIDPLDKFCEELEKSDVVSFGITDYFSAEGFKAFKERFEKKYPDSEKRFFFNLELRLNETVNKALEEINIHLLFNPDSFEKIDKFLSKLNVVKTGKDETPIVCSDLKTEKDFMSATVTRQSISSAFDDTFGKKADRRDHFLVITAANNDGIRPERGKKRKEGICDEVDKFSDAVFGNSSNINYFLDIDRYDGDVDALPKPVISCSDSHSFDDLDNFLGKRSTKEVEDNGKKSEIIYKDVTWIKADTTYDGLRQILYEPKAGERISIGPTKPDEKSDYKVIRKIKFDDSKNFPSEIVLNGNLSSIIGSRSSGKSALLAYIAHSINPIEVERMTLGPGEGSDYRWGVVNVNCSIEWSNGKTNEDSPGNVVYVPQNYLFEKSKDADEIKEKIKPVLFRLLPEFENKYNQALSGIDDCNNQISEQIDEWFLVSYDISAMVTQLKELGDKKSILIQQKEILDKIKILREKNKLSESDLKLYQEVSSQILDILNANKEIDTSLGFFSGHQEDKFFTTSRITLTPNLSQLPPKLLSKIKINLEKVQLAMVGDVNKEVSSYITEIKKEKEVNDAKLLKLNSDHKELIEKYQRNTELENLVKLSNNYSDILKKVERLEVDKKTKGLVLLKIEKNIVENINKRSLLLEGLMEAIQSSDQSDLVGIKFGIEIDLSKEDVDSVSQLINIRTNTDFVIKNELKIDLVFKDPSKFLSDLYLGQQKINGRSEKKDVAKNVLKLTAKILFTAEMEGDKIGGFSESTMTPGKRALFALKLILAESDDTWPLLIDQPEDDLDSRSIYDEVVPFLKEKKKERQIIMVSHNANLVVGSDSEQLIVANRNGNDRKNLDGKQFNYLTGSLEFSRIYDQSSKDTLNSQGVCEHACSILDGGKTAFENRKNKYNLR